MKLKFYVLFGLLFFVNVAFSQDSIQYSSDAEKANIENYIKNKKVDSFSLFFSIDNGNESEQLEARKICEKWINGIKERKIDFSKEKNLKMLLEEIHEAFLYKYVENTQFSKIFSHGEFNCVTASVLYCMLLNQLGFVTELKELKTHVYLTVKSGDKFLDVETTIPEDLVRITKKTKSIYIARLLENKLVTQSEVDEKGVEQLFDEIYYENKTINLVQLAGLTYGNFAVTYLQDKNYFKSLNYFRISRNLYPRIHVNAACGEILNILSNQASNYSFYSLIREQLLFSDLYDPLNLSGALAHYVTAEVFKNSKIEELYHLDSFIKPEIIRNPKTYFETKFVYIMALGEYYYKIDSFEKASHYMKECYEMNPLNLDAEHNLKNCVRNLAVAMVDSFQKVDVADLRWLFGFNMFNKKGDYQDLIFKAAYSIVNSNKSEKIWSPSQLDSNAVFLISKLNSAPLSLVEEEMIAECYLQLAYTYFNMGDKKRTAEIVKAAYKKLPANESIQLAKVYYVKD